MPMVPSKASTVFCWSVVAAASDSMFSNCGSMAAFVRNTADKIFLRRPLCLAGSILLTIDEENFGIVIVVT